MRLRRPQREFYGLTWVGWLNMLVLQWLGLRLAYVVPAAGVALAPPRRVGWALAWGVLPLAGWWGALGSRNYVNAFKRRCWTFAP